MEGSVALVLGTRPEMIKLAPVVRACQDRGRPFELVHTGQHYSDSLDTVFFDQLELPRPTHHLGVGSQSHGAQTAEMIRGVESVLQETEPSAVLVQGDTNSVLAGAIAASKLEPTLGHVEAGLRSFDREMPEEVNRRLADHASDLLFAPTEQSATHLRAEGIDDDRIVVTGNTVVDALFQHRSIAESKSDVLTELSLVAGEYVLVTAHRAENVDDPETFAAILSGVERVCETFGVEAIYPVHPRARERLSSFDLTVPSPIRLVEPADYLDFIRLQSDALAVLTDSGGVQEEACVLGTPCVTLRENTERPETLTEGSNALAGTDPDRIHRTAVEMLETDGDWENPYGDGTAAERILDALERKNL